MVSVPRITSRSSSLAGTRSGDDTGFVVHRPRTPDLDTSSEDNTLSQSITNSSTSSRRQKENVRPAPSTIRSSQSLPPSPLDNIPSKLYDRFPRFSMTTEASQPDLSIEDVTSTRFSIDEEGIIAMPRQPGKLHRTLRKALSHQTMLLKKAKVGMRRMPSHLGLVSKLKDKFDQVSSPTKSEIKEDSVSENAPVLPAIPRQSAELQLKTQAQENDPFVYRSSVRENTYRSVSKLSALEEHRVSFDADQETPRPATSVTVKPKREVFVKMKDQVTERKPLTHFPPNIKRFEFPGPPISFNKYASTTTVNSYHTARERPPLRRPSPLTRRSHESNLSSRQNSVISLNQTQTQRPYSSYSRPVSAPSEDWRAPLQRASLFVEMSEQNKVPVVFVLPSNPGPSVSMAPVSSQPHSRATSVHSLGSNIDRPAIIRRSKSVVKSTHRDKSQRKVPLFVPKRLEMPSPSGEDERLPHPGRRDSGLSATDGATSGSVRLINKKSECSNWSMSYQEGPVGHDSIDLDSDSATIRPVKRGPLNDIMNHFSSNRNKSVKYTMEGTDNLSARHTSFAKGCGSCVRRLSRAFRGKHPDELTSSSRENLNPQEHCESS